MFGKEREREKIPLFYRVCERGGGGGGVEGGESERERVCVCVRERVLEQTEREKFML